MGNYDNNYDDDEYEQNGSDLVKDLRKQLRDKSRELDDLTKELGQFREQARKATVSDVLSKRGINPKVAAFIPSDVEATEDAVSKWLDEYGDVFGAAQQGEPAAQEATPQAQAQSTVTDEQQAQWQQIQESEHAGVVNAAVGGQDLLQKLEAVQGQGLEAIAQLLAGQKLTGEVG
jgi:hypothetical protein